MVSYMDLIIVITIAFYILSTIGYLAFLFKQQDYFNKTGLYLLIVGFVAHTIVIIGGFIKQSHIPVSNLHETLSIACWSLSGVFLAVQYKFNLKILGVFAAPLITMIMLVAFQLPRDPVQTQNVFSNFWLVFHIAAIFTGEAALALACGVGILYLLQERAIKTKKRGFFFKRLPSLDLIDSTGYACLVVGFTLLTIGLITGFVYAKTLWGRFWAWDPKEVWSGITWLLYAALLHARITTGWRGRRAAFMAIIGFGLLVFTFLGVNFLLEGHHGIFTQG